MGFLGTILNFLSGNVATTVLNLYKAKLESGNTHERIAAELAEKDLAVEARIQELRAQIIIAEQGRWYTAMVRPLFAMPFIIYIWKTVVWDKIVMSGTVATDPLSPELWAASTIILTGYFVGKSIEGAVKAYVARR